MRRKKVIGRPRIGETRKVSITLPKELWEEIDRIQKEGNFSRSEVIREIIESFFDSRKRGLKK